MVDSPPDSVAAQFIGASAGVAIRPVMATGFG
jgi:hypothetical protein